MQRNRSLNAKKKLMQISSISQSRYGFNFNVIGMMCFGKSNGQTFSQTYPLGFQDTEGVRKNCSLFLHLRDMLLLGTQGLDKMFNQMNCEALHRN